jgi:hypothetical protein
LCSACALVSAAVLGRLTCLRLGVDILITRDIGFVPAGRPGKITDIRSGCRAGRSRSAEMITTLRPDDV